MSKYIYIVLLSFFYLSSSGQIKISYTKPSQKETLKTEIGLLTTEIEYYRPSKRGRKIFGGLVSYDSLWRTGANINTKLSFDHNVIFGNAEVPAGTYTLFTIPGQDYWEIILHTEYSKYGAPEVIEEENVVSRFSVRPVKVDRPLEVLQLYFTEVTASSAVLNLAWENVIVPMELTVPVQQILTDKLFKSHVTHLSNLYAASYELSNAVGEHALGVATIDKVIFEIENNSDLDAYLKAISRQSLLLSAYSVKAQIYANAKDYTTAIHHAEEGIKVSQERGLPNFENHLKRLIKEWRLK